MQRVFSRKRGFVVTFFVQFFGNVQVQESNRAPGNGFCVVFAIARSGRSAQSTKSVTGIPMLKSPLTLIDKSAQKT
jgi:hypothetical protein